VNFSFNAVTEWLDKAAQTAVANRKQVLIGFAGLVGLICLIIGYSYYNHYSQAQAHKAFQDALKYYQASVAPGARTYIKDDIIEFGSDEDKWKKVEEVFKTAYDKHKGAGIGPMFRILQSEALVNLHKIDDAVTLLESAVKALPSHEMRDFYKLKLALVKLESPTETIRKAGFAELKAIAENAAHLANEAGLYYLGLYFWTQKDFAQAKNYWQQLMVKYGMKEARDQSGFTELVKAKLKLISAEW